MMNNLFFIEHPTYFFRHNKSMFKDSSLFVCHRMISFLKSFVYIIFSHSKKSFPKIMILSSMPIVRILIKTFFRTEKILTFSKFIWSSVYCFFAINTFYKFSRKMIFSVMTTYKFMGSSIDIFQRNFITTTTCTLYFHNDIRADGCKFVKD